MHISWQDLGQHCITQTCTFFMSAKHLRHKYHPKWNRKTIRSLVSVLVTFLTSGEFMSGQICYQIISENIFFRAVDFRIADCGLWICLIHTLQVRKLRLNSLCDLLFGYMAHKQWSKNLNSDLVQVRRFLFDFHWYLFVNVLQNTEGKINSFLQYHAFLASRHEVEK